MPYVELCVELPAGARTASARRAAAGTCATFR